MSEQKELDVLFNKCIDDYRNISDRELTRLVQLINEKYAGFDLILSHLSKRELVRGMDYITRAMFELTKRKGIFDTSSKHYIITNLCKARGGLESSSRKKIFNENGLSIEDEINYRKNYIKFRFFNRDKPILLMKHIYGYGSITNWVEGIVEEIEHKYLSEYGYSISADDISIYYRDVQFEGTDVHYASVKFEDGLTKPLWSEIDSEWFEELWESHVVGNSLIKEPIFFKKNQEYSAYKKIKEIFLEAKKSIQIIDPYTDDVLFSLIETINTKITVQAITSKLEGDFETTYRKLQKERGNIEIHKSKGQHDRFVIIDRKYVFLFGSSLNAFGNRPATIVPIENKGIQKNIIGHFEESWITSKDLIKEN